MSERCALCHRPLPPDRRLAIMRWLVPRPPLCMPADEACYRGFAERLGLTPTDAQIQDAIAQVRDRE